MKHFWVISPKLICNGCQWQITGPRTKPFVTVIQNDQTAGLIRIAHMFHVRREGRK